MAAPWPTPLQDIGKTTCLPLLEKDSALQAVTLLRHLQSLHPLACPDDRIWRTLERRIRQWRALNGPERDIIFRQSPEPGYMAQSDFTHADDLWVMIAGQPFAHLLYHFVMVYSRPGTCRCGSGRRELHGFGREPATGPLVGGWRAAQPSH